MLAQLAIRNLGLIEDAVLDFGPGLHAITGETGVGKSMLLGSLALLRGERSRADMVRSGCAEAHVAGFFTLDGEPQRRAVAEAAGVPVEDGELRLERRLRANGRHRALVNGEEVPHALLARIGALLFEFQGQRAQLSLLEPREQLRFLDRWAQLGTEVAEFGAAFARARALGERIDGLRRAAAERNDRRLFLSHVASELREAALRTGEREELERELGFLEERDAIHARIQGALERFHDGEGSVLDALDSTEKELAAFRALHAGLGEFLGACATARAALGDGVRALRAIEADIEQDPGRAQEARDRLDLLVRLEERYRRRGDALAAYHAEVEAELEVLCAEDAGLPELERDLATQLDDLGARARAIAQRRRRAAERLARAMTGELADLGMQNARFEARLETMAPDDGWLGLGSSGGDRLEFWFGPNPGEGETRLRETASGGELSRVMLALRCTLTDTDGVPVLIFDEVDAGVGGRLGVSLGKKLAQIARSRQVICVTHLPQIAAYGVGHFRVAKVSKKGRTATRVERLDPAQRLEEVAAMIRGEGTSATSLAEAREMLREAAR